MQPLIDDIRLFCETHGLSIWQFGALSLKDKAFVKSVENGRRIWPETESKVRRFMATYKPDAEQEDAA